VALCQIFIFADVHNGIGPVSLRVTEAQIIGMIKEQEAGMATAEVCRRHGLSPATFYKLKAKYGGMRPARLP